MAHPFTVESSVEIEATPDEVWEALTTGSEMDGWFIDAPNAVDPGSVAKSAWPSAASRGPRPSRVGSAASLRPRGRTRT